ncbi:MAG: hypothetical protein IJV35_10065 [Neisseriaceae bacterium]|nr:hypothetical protein [Neisseriaceae bacterium]
MFSQKIIKKCSSVAIFRSMFIALLIGIASSGYGCSDTEYLTQIGKEYEKLLEKLDTTSSSLSKMHTLSNFARNVSNISSHCENNSKFYDSKRKMRTIKTYADSLEKNTDNRIKITNRTLERTMNGMKKDSSTEELFFGLLLNVADSDTIDTIDKNIAHDIDRITNELKNW